jgi:hypothetical protein
MSGSMVLAVGAATAEPSAGATWWLTVGVPLVIVAAAIVYAAQRSSRLQRWHDDATLLYELGAQLGEAVRARASHSGAAQNETWADLRDRDARVVAQARRLVDRAPLDLQRERALDVSRAATVLGEQLERRRPVAGASLDQPPGTELLTATSSLQAALFALRSAV